ncbi:MAG: 2,3-bisphosphoglycerate-independent phosphoglycerate mutase [Gemmatimonadota bacterium]
MRKVLLIILDGWGPSDFEGSPSVENAIEQASVPTFRTLLRDHPSTRLACSGADVGLPDGQMGNSEVGHLNLGGGRIVYQDIARIDNAIAEGAFADQLGLDQRVRLVRERGSTLHVVGLVSDGGVHSHLRHFLALLDEIPTDVRVRLHCITDGRDTSPTGGVEYLGTLDRACEAGDDWAIATVCGRYWTMDRDRRWERTRRGYDLIVNGLADVWADDLSFLPASYGDGVTDEFLEPTGIRGVGEAGVGEDDVILLMNFRADRMRQLSEALSTSDFDGFDRGGAGPGTIVTMTQYDDDLPVAVAFPPEHVRAGLSEHLAGAGRRQLKVAETEKYAHVTYFFNGGEEEPWDGEERSLVPSPKVATYDLQPEMSAAGVTDAVLAGLAGDFDFILVNYANPDMVGHTGVIPAAISAVEAVDACVARLLEAVDDAPEWVALVTADHGNCERMLTPEGKPHTAHTTEPVDFVVYDPKGEAVTELTPGRLADVAPTVLGLMGVVPPGEMTGRDLLGG